MRVDKIVVHHREEDHTERKQEINIHYNFLGHIDIPKLSLPEVKQYGKSFGRNNPSGGAVCVTA